MAKGIRITEKTYELIKQMLVQGYSAKKISQMLPEEIAVSLHTIYKVDNSANFKDYCGEAPEPKPQEKVVQIVPHVQTKEIVDAVNALNEKMDRICGMLRGLIDSLS